MALAEPTQELGNGHEPFQIDQMGLRDTVVEAFQRAHTIYPEESEAVPSYFEGDPHRPIGLVEAMPPSGLPDFITRQTGDDPVEHRVEIPSGGQLDMVYSILVSRNQPKALVFRYFDRHDVVIPDDDGSRRLQHFTEENEVTAMIELGTVANIVRSSRPEARTKPLGRLAVASK